MAGGWSFNGSNPIVGYTVGFELAGMLTPEVLLRVSALGSLLSKDLPRKVEQQALTFQMGATQAQAQPPKILGGVVFEDIGRDGTVLKQLVVSSNSITYRTASYERWAEYWPVAERILSRIAEVVLPTVGINAFLLNAENKFNLVGEQDTIPIKDLIRHDCRFISPDMLKKTGPCHSFYGFLEDSLNPPGKRIDNLNVSVSVPMAGQEGSGYSVDLVVNIRLILADPLFDFKNTFGELSGPNHVVGDIFKDLHESNNRLFADVVDEKLCRDIPGVPKQ